LIQSRARTSALSKANELLEQEKAEHQRTVERLNKTTQKYLNIFENIQNVYYEITLDGIILEMSPSIADFSGYHREELIGKSFMDFYVDPEDRKKFLKHLLLWGKVSDYELLLKDKSATHRFCSVTAKLITDGRGRPEKIIGSLSDVTERKQAEMAYQKSEARMRRILDASIDRIRQVDKDMRIIWANKAAMAAFHQCPDEIVGQTCYGLFTDRDRPCDECPTIKARQTGQIERAVMYKPKVKGLTGDSYWDVYCVPLKNEFGDVDSYIQVSRDITEEKKAEGLIHRLSQQLLQAQERERQMISYELHDRIAQDLSALKIGFDTLLDGQPVIQEELRQKTQKLSDVLLKAIHGVRNLSYELRPPDLDEMDIVNALKIYTEDFAEMSHIRIDFQSNLAGRLHLDPESKIHLYRLVQEGLSNTHKHAHASSVWIKLGFAYAKISLSIKDNGIGFDVKERERRLDKEKRLGLRSMRERVNLLGGQIKIQSRPGEGTKIYIHFPFKDNASDAQNTHRHH
jgi:PAS domain S-box-containing protein